MGEENKINREDLSQLEDEVYILIEALRLTMPDFVEVECNDSLTEEQKDILRKAKRIIDET